MKSVLKSVGETRFDQDELKELYNLVKEQVLLSWHSRLGNKSPENTGDKGQYRIDFDIFSKIVPQLLSWPCSKVFLQRAFRVSTIKVIVLQ